MSDYRGRHVLVIGLGKSGKGAIGFLLRRGAHVVGVDQNAALFKTDKTLQEFERQGVTLLPDHIVTDITPFSLLVLSPGVPAHHPLLLMARERGLPVIGEIELACRDLSQPVLAVTGTNGKTTVTLLTTHVLNACGRPARAVGNVGAALTAEVDLASADEVLVMELSSYQLETMQSRVIDAAVVLNITPDHLERHGTMENYARAKLSIAKCLKEGGRLFLQAAVAQDYGYLIPNVPYETFCATKHDKENGLAAARLCSVLGIDLGQFARAAANFQKPPHRIAFVREQRGVQYYNDSKGTNLDAVQKAVNTVPGPIHLIAGGVDKGASYLPWAEAFGGKVCAIYAIGQAAAKIKSELHGQIPVQIFPTLEAAVRRAAMNAARGQTVLLSPGCASFDMFRDYAHRGEEFQKIVAELPE